MNLERIVLGEISRPQETDAGQPPFHEVSGVVRLTDTQSGDCWGQGSGMLSHVHRASVCKMKRVPESAAQCEYLVPLTYMLTNVRCFFKNWVSKL